MAQDRLRAAKTMIDQGRLLDARNILEGVPGEKAEDWRRKLNDRIGVAPTGTIPREPVIPMPPPVYSAALTPAEIEHRNRLLAVNDMTRAQAQTKSYTGALVAVIILYFLLFVPGLIANVLFYNDGKRMEQIAGVSLPGVKALGVLRTLMFVVLLLIFMVLAFYAVMLFFQTGAH